MLRFKFRVSMKPTLQDIHALSFNSSSFIVKDIQTYKSWYETLWKIESGYILWK